MYVKKLQLKNFLSYTDGAVEFFDGLNIITGGNGFGKTNMLEAVYLSSVGKSSRGTRDKDLIKWNTRGGAKVKIEIEKTYGKTTIETLLTEDGEKCVSIDSIPIAKMGELMGGLTAILFSPSEMRLIKESPADRRRFLDISLSQQSKLYFYTLIRYNKLLAQRNKILKEKSPSLKDMLLILEEQLLPAAELIILKRKAFAEKLSAETKKQHAVLSGGEDFELVYETEELDYSDIKGSLSKIYKKTLEKDMRLEYTTAGPHRDDLKIMAGGIDIRKYGSQGQQRTATLSMKLAECHLHKEAAGEMPVLLLDDVLSELDITRQKALLNAAKGIQTIITCTEFDHSLVDSPLLKITIGADSKIVKKAMINN